MCGGGGEEYDADMCFQPRRVTREIDAPPSAWRLSRQRPPMAYSTRL